MWPVLSHKDSLGGLPCVAPLSTVYLLFQAGLLLLKFGQEKQHKHKLFCPDFPRTFLTLTPGRPWVEKFLPITGAAEKRTFWCGRPQFSARTSMTRRVLEELCTKKFALIFWPLKVLWGICVSNHTTLHKMKLNYS